MATVKLDPAKGVQIPNMTTTERNAVSSPETGALIWNTTTSAINQYNGSAWEATDTNTQADITGKLNLSGGTMTGTIAGFTSTGIDDNADATAITIDSAENVGIGTASPSSKLYVNQDSTSATGVFIGSASTTGSAMQIYGDSLTTGSCLYIRSNSSDTSARKLVQIVNEHNNADAAIPLYIKNDGNATTVEIVSANGSGHGLQMQCDNLSSGKIAQLYSNSPDTGPRKLVHIKNDHASATGTTALEVTQDSDGPCALFLGNAGGGKVGINNSSPSSRLEVGGGINHGDIRSEDIGQTSYSGNYGGIAGGTIKMVSGGVGSGSGTCTWTWAAPSWKAYTIVVDIAGTSGGAKFFMGGYGNGTISSGTMERFAGANLTAPTYSGSGQSIIIACTPPGTHPFCSIEITTSGSAGSPQADQITVAWT